MLPNRTLYEKGRIIWDAPLVNECCDKARFFPAAQPRHSEVARLILWWQSRFPAIPVLFAEKDIKLAMPSINGFGSRVRTAPCSVPTLPVALTWGSPRVSQPSTAMASGWTGAGRLWGLPGVSSSCVVPWHDSTHFRSLMLMDDAVVIEPDLGLRPWQSLRTAEAAARQILGPEAIITPPKTSRRVRSPLPNRPG